MSVQRTDDYATTDFAATATETPAVPVVGQASRRATQSEREMSSRTFAESLGRTVFTFWRGRIALFAILKAMHIGAGDEVIVPGYTCFVLPSAIIFSGAKPLYADIDPRTFNLSVETIEAALRERPQANPKAIVIQHTFGLPADTARIVSWARMRGIATIEDCAHAIGSGYRDPSGARFDAGALADAAFFSSHWNKPVSTGIGGWAIAAKPEIQDGLRRFWNEQCIAPTKMETAMLAAQVGARKILDLPHMYWTVRSVYHALYKRGLVVGSSSREELRGEMPSTYAKRMSAFQQWLLKRRMASDSLVEHRRKIQKVYDAALIAAGMPTFAVPSYADPVLLRYPVRVSNKSRVLSEAKRRGVEIGEWYTSPVDMPEGVGLDTVGYESGTCPEGERASREVIHFPMGRNVSEESARQMLRFVKDLS
ncbi:MAG: DegT/DnrJ/EryC1/StrS family aminotransferase [Candidatus Acidiferrales bacterium]